MAEQVSVMEKHYTPKELADMWGFSENTIRRLFQDRPGVLKMGTSFRKGGRGYVSLRIPASVAGEVHQEMSR